MKTSQSHSWHIAHLILAVLAASGPLTAAPLGSAFDFQGRLTAAGDPAEGEVDIRFALFDSPAGGTPIGPVLTNSNVALDNGLFTVTLDFGPGLFTGETYWLELTVRPANGVGSFGAPMSPRHPLRGTPYALHAVQTPWTGLTGVPSGFADGVDNESAVAAGDGLILDGVELRVNFAGSGAATTVARSDHEHSAEALTSGFLPAGRLAGEYTGRLGFTNPSNEYAGDGSALTGVNASWLGGVTPSGFWRLDGNGGTSPGTDFLGTTDDEALELRVDNERALRLEPTGGAPNVIGGSENNAVTGVAQGVTIGGGADNSSGGEQSTIGGGLGNTISNLGDYSTIPGGRDAGTSHYGQWAYASGQFDSAGDAQTSVYVLRNMSTINPLAPTVELFLNGANARMTLSRNTAWVFDMRIVALGDNGFASAFEVQGLIKRTSAGLTTMVGSPSVSTIANEGSRGVNVTANDTTDALQIIVTGDSFQDVRWVATVRTTEVSL